MLEAVLEELESTEEALFDKAAVNSIIKESIESALQKSSYVSGKVSQWTSTIVEGCMKRLTQLNKTV